MARETISGISVPIAGTGEPPDFVADLRRIAEDAGETFAAKINEDQRLPLGIRNTVSPTGAATPGNTDIVALSFVNIIEGNHDGILNNFSPGFAFGLNSYTVTGDQIDDCAGLQYLYGNLIETAIRLPAGAQTLGFADGLACQVAFSHPTAGSTVDRMASLRVIAPERKDGAAAGTANEVYGMLIEECFAVGASTKVRSMEVRGKSQLGAVLFSGDSSITSVGNTNLVLSANAPAPTDGPFITLIRNTDGTRPREIDMKTPKLTVGGEIRISDPDSKPYFSLGDNVGADAHPGGNAADYTIGALRGFTHFGLTEAASVEFRSVFNTNDYNGADIVLATKNTAGVKNDQLRAYGQGGIAVNIPGVGFRDVVVGAADSAGAGFRTLRVAN